ncbi:uncharacterized protein [Spinacia oleracea]|nr:uncharacterized protein LOC110798674 isoform X2 [Spinacia oleracea]XP_056684807.1 uncharacterized protein LOC110798674 isoform X2 [Spinacia oleracea]XP_056684808.1 uncharacterized protein LOC110798674 isoform X2 [Spinacia oleracea]
MSGQVDRKIPVISYLNASAIGQRITEELKAGSFGLGRIVPSLNDLKSSDTKKKNLKRKVAHLLNLPSAEELDTSHPSKKEFAKKIVSMTNQIAHNFVELGEVIVKADKDFPGTENIKKIQGDATEAFTKISKIQADVSDFDAFLRQPGVLDEIDHVEKSYSKSLEHKNCEETCPLELPEFDVPSFNLGLNFAPPDADVQTNNEVVQTKGGNTSANKSPEQKNCEETCPLELPEFPSFSLGLNFTPPDADVQRNNKVVQNKGGHNFVDPTDNTTTEFEVRRDSPRRENKNLSLYQRSPYSDRYVDVLKRMSKIEKQLCNYVLMARDSNGIFYSNGNFKIERHNLSSLLEDGVSMSVIDIWALILNQKDLGRGLGSPKRFFCSATASVDVTQSHIQREQMIKGTLDFKIRLVGMVKCSKVSISDIDLAFFPIIHDGCYVILCFNFKYSKVDVIDQRILIGKVNEIYGGYVTIMGSFFSKFLKDMKDPRANLVKNFEPRVIRMVWKSNELYVVDSGVLAMRHMETYMGQATSWDPLLKKIDGHVLRNLRAKYCCEILKNEYNVVKEDVLKKAKL